jgi:phosphoglycolate phosphatase (TIGR01487 family)
MHENIAAGQRARHLPYRVLPSAIFTALPATLCVALASDYDGTLAENGRVSDHTVQFLQKFRRSGRKLFLVTGRVLRDLESVFSRFDLFDCIVAENGAVLYSPGTREQKALAQQAPRAFIEALNRRGVEPLEVGETIVATRQPHETEVLETIRNLGLELQVIFNKGAVMVLPAGVNKKSGLAAALELFGISEHNVVGIGDAENDHAFLQFCEFSVAVANAHPAIADISDLNTRADDGDGVIEAVELILNNGLRSRKQERHSIPVGFDGKEEIWIPAYGSSMLVSGASRSGKSKFVAGFLETLFERRYQACVIDPEGDYQSFPGAICLGDKKTAPSTEEVLQILQKPDSQVIVSLIGMPLGKRPEFLDELLARLQDLRRRLGRPHWIFVDEAHHMLSPDGSPASAVAAAQLGNLALITVHPDQIAPSVLSAIDVLIAVGPAADEVMDAFATAAKVKAAGAGQTKPNEHQVLAWFPKIGEVRCLDFRLSKMDRKRHKRNYAHGELGEDRSFYFRGPEQKLNLRAHNLATFIRLAVGLDDETWLYHLNRGDYSRWIRESIKDDVLADEVHNYEEENPGNPHKSREGIKSAIERYYIAPA